jgi:hypothetical protein
MQEQRRAERVVHPPKMFFMAQPIPLALFLLNVIGAIAYLARASSAWAIPQERSGNPLDNGRAVRLVRGHFSDHCIFLSAEFCLGSSHRSPTMAGCRLLAADSAGLAGGSGDRFCASPTPLPESRASVSSPARGGEAPASHRETPLPGTTPGRSILSKLIQVFVPFRSLRPTTTQEQTSRTAQIAAM